MAVITKRLEFDYGHRLIGHEGKCASLHGHRGAVEITCEGDLDPVGRVIDFGKIKELVGAWIDTNWDHAMVLKAGDPILLVRRPEDVFGPKPPYVLQCNPSAENMADFLLGIATRLLEPHGVEVRRVRFFETPTCWADAELLDFDHA